MSGEAPDAMSVVETMERERRPRRSLSKSSSKMPGAVALVRSSGESTAGVSRELDVTESALRAWFRHAEVDDAVKCPLAEAGGHFT